MDNTSPAELLFYRMMIINAAYQVKFFATGPPHNLCCKAHQILHKKDASSIICFQLHHNG